MRCVGGNSQHGYLVALGRNILFQISFRSNGDVAPFRSDFGRIAVENAGYDKASLRKPGKPRKRSTDFSLSNDADTPLLIETENLTQS